MTSDNVQPQGASTSGTWVDGTAELTVSPRDSRFEISNSRGIPGGVSPCSAEQAGDTAWWSYGFVDTQVNGYAGVDYSGRDLSADDVRSVVEALRDSGTTHHVPTVITNSQERICANLDLITALCRDDGSVAAAIPAVHVEGPYISNEDGPRGAHDASFVRDPDVGELREWIAAARGLLRVVTLAPERSGAMEAIRFLVDQGIVVAIGHTAADSDTIEQAIAAGATHSTHLGNGSHATLPRLKNYLWSQLAADDLTAGIIPDGFHLPAEVMQSVVRAKGASRIVSVSDVAPVGGTEPGRRRWGAIDIEVHQDGHVSLAGTPFLAGAGHLLDRGVAQLLAASDLDLSQVVATCTVNAARLIRQPFDHLATPPAVGTVPESLIRFTVDAQEVNITHVIVDGVLTYSGGART